MIPQSKPMRSSCIGAAVFLLALSGMPLLTHGSAIPLVHLRHLDKSDGAQLAKLFGLEIRTEAEEVYSGSYGYYVTRGKEVLHGPFTIKSEHTGSDNSDPYEVIKYTHLVEYTGAFKHGRKAGSFVERLVNDDGVDIYEKWQVTMFYEPRSGKCQWGEFRGRIGHAMPEMTHRDAKPHRCAFSYFVESAWAKWERIYADSVRRERRR